MDRVAFITTQRGDDLIVSFAVQVPDDPSEIESLTLLRTPKYEFIFDDHERGVHVSFERHVDDEDADEFLQRIDYVKEDGIVRIRTNLHQYELDVSKVEKEKLRQMRKVLRKMNYDGRFYASGV